MNTTTLLAVSASLFVLELLYFRIADRFNIIDKPNERSSHSRVTLRGGGIVFPIAVLIYYFVGGFQYPWFVLGTLLIAAISFWDDISPLSNKIRLPIHFVALLLLFQQWEFLQQYSILILPTMIVCAGIINAYNFMDGINGITGGYSTVVLAGLAFVNRGESQFIDPNLIHILIAALLVFNIFNFRTRAKCFAGDVGSVSIALAVLFVLGSLILKTRDVTWICFLAVYGVDSVLTIIHRLCLRENIFKPHRKHLYQLLANELKIPHLPVSLLYSLLQGIIIIGYILCRPLGAAISWGYLLGILLVLSLLYILVKYRWFHLHHVQARKP